MDWWKKELVEEAIEIIARHFHISPNEDGKYDTEDYDWEAGCYCNHTWMSPKELLECMKEFIDDHDYMFEHYYER